MAGKCRTTMLGKAERVGHPPTWFTAPHLSEHEAQRIFDSLHRSTCCAQSSQSSLRAKPPACSRRLMRYIPSVKGMAEHREFLLMPSQTRPATSCIFDVVSRERWFRRAFEANRGNFGMMTRLLEKIIDTERIQPLRRAILFLSREN